VGSRPERGGTHAESARRTDHPTKEDTVDQHPHTRSHAKAVGALAVLVQALRAAGTDPETLTGLEDLYEVALESPPTAALDEPEPDDSTWEAWEFEGGHTVAGLLK
jgi:hypothetical protein